MPSAEERAAARFGLYTWTGWTALPMADRTAGIAWYRLHQLIELHQGDAVGREMKKNQPRPRRSAR